jgi:pyrroloquinoline-quinone synthase
LQFGTLDDRLTDIVARWNLLQHPFYQAWVAGTLTRAELCDYALQYAHVVAAIPTWLETTAALHPEQQTTLARHAREESDHVALWHEFSAALGVGAGPGAQARPNAATQHLLDQCRIAAERGNGAAVVWAMEAQSPAVSAEKLRGLAAHYGIHAHSGARYFALHAELDKDHERELRAFMQDQGPAAEQTAAALAEAATRSLWDLLTSVHAHA